VTGRAGAWAGVGPRRVPATAADALQLCFRAVHRICQGACEDLLCCVSDPRELDLATSVFQAGSCCRQHDRRCG
jgi:hypothetical protein